MTAKHTLHQTLRSFLAFRKERAEPLWARLVVGTAMVLGIGLVLVIVSVFLMAVPRADWWSTALGHNLLLGVVTGIIMLAVLRAVEWLLPARAIDKLAAMRDWCPAALVSLVLMAGMVLGVRIAYLALSAVYEFDMWKKLSGVPMVQLKFLIFALLVGAVNWIWWLLQAKEKALTQQAAESQLRMLQAQIEPHFLFNTLANVQSLIRTDAPRAQLMLETFTDYLRASLGQMRDTDVTLEVELETARSYLQLMQIRMGRRLTFTIEAPDQARLASCRRSCCSRWWRTRSIMAWKPKSAAAACTCARQSKKDSCDCAWMTTESGWNRPAVKPVAARAWRKPISGPVC